MDDILRSVFRGDHSTLKDRVDILARISPEAYAEDLRLIFRRAWVCAARTLDVPAPGTYRVVDLPTYKTSLLITRAADGKIRAFHNMCRHRGNKLVREGAGKRAHFACGFHGWVFGADGALELVTDETQFPHIDKCDLGLLPVHCEAWEGLVFVCLDETPRWTLREWIGEMHDQFGGYWDDKERHTTYEVEVRCNWHLALNAFIEGYHTAYVHKNTAPDYQGGRSNPNRHRPLIETFARHQRYSAPRNPEHRETPAEEIAYRHSLKLAPAYDGKSDMLPPGVNPLRSDKWAFDVVQFFPNLVMLNSNYWHLGIWFWPLDHERTVIRAERLFFKARNAADRLAQAYSRTRAREVIREDLNTLEATQEMLSSGAMRHIHLSQQELALQHHFRMVEEMLADV